MVESSSEEDMIAKNNPSPPTLSPPRTRARTALQKKEQFLLLKSFKKKNMFLVGFIEGRNSNASQLKLFCIYFV